MFVSIGIITRIKDILQKLFNLMIFLKVFHLCNINFKTKDKLKWEMG